MRYQYEAVQQDGRIVAGVIDAASERGAHRDLVKRGMRPTAIAAAPPPRRPAPRRKRFAAPSANAGILKQLSVLIEGGVPVADAAAVLAEATEDPRLAAAFAELNAGLRRGESFPASFAQSFPAIPEHIQRMVAAGDFSGRLAEALADTAAETEHAARVRTELRQALVYPVFLVGFGLLAILFIFIVVVPRFAAIFRGKFDQLPLLSYLVIAFGIWFREHLAVALAAIGAVGAAVAYAATRPGLRSAAIDLLWRLPVFRSWLHDIAIARWAAVFARLLENRVPLIQGLELARTALPGRALQARLTQVERDVRTGAALATALERRGFLPGPALTLIRVGERSGTLAAMVRSIAMTHEAAVRDHTRVALSILEPVAIILIGGMIGVVATAIFLAITSINRVPGL